MREPRTNGTLGLETLDEFDGVVCFGGVDWWYHNRGHYDLQMMREFARELPVLYVNSIGMRTPTPREGAMFARRVARKTRSWLRGRVQVERNFSVASPVSWPGGGAQANSALLAAQVRRAALASGMRRPLVWVACPAAADAALRLSSAGLVFQRTDRFEAFHGVDAQRVERDVATLLERADLTLYCSRTLQASERARRALFVDHGVDARRFSAAGESDAPAPEDLKGLRRPLVGFVGGIDAHTFDDALFRRVVELTPQADFALVGGCSLPSERISAPNVRHVGRKPFEQVARYMAACDVLIMPWRDNDWIRACNPIKLKEYLAVGRPIVSTPFDELSSYAGLVRVARGAEAFADELRSALSTPHDPAPGRARVRDESWAQRALRVLDELSELGLHQAVGALAP